jgi:fructose-1,6-bisphosphatase I
MSSHVRIHTRVNLVSYRDIKIPETGKIYSFNEGNSALWDPAVQEYMNSLKDASKWGGKPYSARYIGSLVGDFHRTLLYGGIYGYPGTDCAQSA